tara:strand:- start:354 stop:902 length:549 start_codon:yes stop_codon:yes gene_type:complete
MKYKEVNNFFENPDGIVEFSKTLTYYSYNTHPKPNSCGRYAGLRSREIHKEHRGFFDYLCHKIVHPHIVDLNKHPDTQWVFATYFSKINSKDKIIHPIHQDASNLIKAGVIYLTKDIDPKSGTSLYNEDNKKIKEFKNKYNKMVMYDPTIPHSLNKFVDNRLVILFFLEQLTYTYNQSIIEL